MSKSPRRPKRLRYKIFRGRDAVRLGLLTVHDLRSSAWRTLFRGIYADSAITITHEVRCLAVSLYVIPPGAAIAGRSAAYLYGAQYIAVDDPVEVLVPAGFGAMTGLAVHRERSPADDHRRHGPITLTNPMRTCWDLALWLDVVEAVVFVDALLARRLVAIADLVAYSQARAGARGWRRLLRVAELADAASASPQESRLRVRLVLSGVPRMVAQYVITRNGHFVARVDLALVQYRIAIEYDGYWHGDKAQLERDRRRLNQLLGADWIVLHVTAARLRDDFDGILREVREAIKKRS